MGKGSLTHIIQTETILKLTDKVVVMPWQELQSTRLWSERPERNGEVHELIGLITDRDDPRIWISNSARIVFLF